MNDDRQWQDLVRDVNTPPETPRDHMWERIDAARHDARHDVTAPEFGGRARRDRTWRLAAAVAAVLVFGFALGRFSAPGPDPAAVVATTGPAPQTAGPRETPVQLYQLAAADLFGRADFLLTDLRTRTCGPADLAEAPAWAAGMLLQTRLLLDSPAGRDPTLAPLLNDLELVLAQIAGLSRDDCTRDLAWIRDGLDQRATLDRLRLAAADRPRRPL